MVILIVAVNPVTFIQFIHWYSVCLSYLIQNKYPSSSGDILVYYLFISETLTIYNQITILSFYLWGPFNKLACLKMIGWVKLACLQSKYVLLCYPIISIVLFFFSIQSFIPFYPIMHRVHVHRVPRLLIAQPPLVPRSLIFKLRLCILK